MGPPPGSRHNLGRKFGPGDGGGLWVHPGTQWQSGEGDVRTFEHGFPGSWVHVPFSGKSFQRRPWWRPHRTVSASMSYRLHVNRENNFSAKRVPQPPSADVSSTMTPIPGSNQSSTGSAGRPQITHKKPATLLHMHRGTRPAMLHWSAGRPHPKQKLQLGYMYVRREHRTSIARASLCTT